MALLRRVLALCLLLQFFISSKLIAQTDESSKALAVLRQNTKMRTLPNGLRVLMYQRGQAPVFSGIVMVRVGGVDEPEGQTGISHMFEHMAFKGTPEIGTTNYSEEKKLLNELEDVMGQQRFDGSLSADLMERQANLEAALSKLWKADDFVRQYRIRGAEDMNATTGKELTTYMSSMPKDSFEFWCQTESERLINPVLRQFYQERDVVMEERRMRYEDSPDGKLYELLLGSAFTVHPYRNPVIGYAHDIRGLTATMTEAFRRKYYVPSNTVVSVVGDISPEKDFPIIEKYFGRIAVGQDPPRLQVIEPEQQGQREIQLNTHAAPQAFIAYKKPNYPHPDDPALGVMSEMLAGTRSSPLHKELVQKRRIVTGIDYDESPGTAYPNLLIFYGVPREPHTNDDFIKGFDEVLQKFKQGPVDANLLEIAKRSLAMDYLAGLQANMSLAENFASAELLHGGWAAVLDWYEKAMAVTASDVQNVAKGYLKPSTRTIGRVESVELPK